MQKSSERLPLWSGLSLVYGDELDPFSAQKLQVTNSFAIPVRTFISYEIANEIAGEALLRLCRH